MKIVIFLFQILGFSFLSLSQLANAGAAIDVNDVSYLWPPVLQKTDAVKLVSLSNVIPRSLFQEIISFSNGGKLGSTVLPTPVSLPAEVKKIENWHLVSMRIDPCAPGLRFYKNDLTKCVQEIRLVAQPFSFDGVWEYYDFAFHIIFEISAGKPNDSKSFQELLDKLLGLKEQNRLAGIETTGKALRVHPGFKSDSFRNSLRDLLVTNLKGYALKKVTFTGGASEEGPWVFFQGLVVNKHFRPEPDPTMNRQSFGQIIPKLPGAGGSVSPLPSNSHWPAVEDAEYGPSIAELFYTGTIDLNRPALLSNKKESKVFKREDLVFAFENPSITDRTNTDCMSCHAAMSRRILLGLANKPNPFKYAAPNNRTTIDSVMPSQSPTNFRIFGWFGASPVVSDRVIHESANVVDLIERQFKN